MKTTKKTIVHLINDIIIGGGAEKMVYNIAKYANLEKFDIIVISLLPDEGYKEQMEKNGIKVYNLNIKKNPFHSMKKIVSILKQTDTLFCWMYYANLIGYFCGKKAKVSKINFGIRQSNINKDVMKWKTRLINRICAKLSNSKYITNIIYNGEKAKDVHERIGYNKEKSKIIINGCEISIFKYNKDSRKKMLQENNNLKDDCIWIMSATRYNKMKDIPNFLNSMKIVKEKHSSIQIFMCGNGFTQDNQELMNLINKNRFKLNQDVFLLGLVNNLPDIFSACDLYVLHSAGEAFPNTLIEAMSCEIECVSTDAGDVSKIYPNKNNIVPIQNTELLSKKICEVLEGDVKKRHPEYREVIKKKYSIENVVKLYESYY